MRAIYKHPKSRNWEKIIFSKWEASILWWCLIIVSLSLLHQSNHSFLAVHVCQWSRTVVSHCLHNLKVIGFGGPWIRTLKSPCHVWRVWKNIRPTNLVYIMSNSRSTFTWCSCENKCIVTALWLSILIVLMKWWDDTEPVGQVNELTTSSFHDLGLPISIARASQHLGNAVIWKIFGTSVFFPFYVFSYFVGILVCHFVGLNFVPDTSMLLWRR